MRLQEDIDFTTLNWVKQELDETLRQARQALEAYAEDPADSSLMRFCATYLHQVQGTLRMVELYGAAMVVEEMEHVAQALLDDQIRVKDDAFASLLRGTLQLPDYLERLQSGHKDVPIVLLPLLNDLRACRGEKLLSEGVLFSPDLTVPLPASVKGPERPVPETELRNVSGRLRMNFQAALVKFLRDQSSSLAVTGLLNALDGLGSISFQEDARRLWWLSSCLLEAIRAGDVEANAAIKLMYGRVDREIKRLVDAGEGAFRAEPPRELLKNLLYYIAQSKGSDGRVAEVKRIYHLDQLIASEQEIEQARDSMVGRNRAVLDTVSVAIKEDLLRVKDALDLFLRTANASVGDLSPQVELLDRIGDTLGVLGLGVPRRVIQEQRQSLSEITAGSRAAEEGVLLDIAGALLFVEASLDDHIERMGSGEEPTATRNAAGDTSFELPQTEVRKILDSLMKEVQSNLQQIKQDVVAFVESGWDHAKAEHIPRLLDEVAGAVRMIHLNEAAELLGATGKFIEVELLRRRRVPTPDQMDRLADAVASIEFYLEATHAQRPGREQILDVTRDSLDVLGYWPVPETPAFEEASTAALAEPVAEPQVDAPPAASAESDIDAAPANSTAPTEPPAAELDFSDIHIDMDALTFSTDGEPAASELSDHQALEQADSSLPSIDLPGSQDLARFAERVGKVAPGMADTTPPPVAVATAKPELRSVVEIAPGRDVADLIVGSAEAGFGADSEQDLTGMRLVETESSGGHGPAEEEFEYEWVEIEQEVIEPAPADELSQFQSAASDDIDEEIREVFLEEVQEEVDNLNRVVPQWVATPADFEKLKPIRRSFHTMKGSGRLVGAMALGEFSWKIEGMLNRVLDKSIAPSAAVIALLQQSVQALPQLLAALRGESVGGVDIAGIMDVADRLAAGEEAWLASKQPTRRMEKVRVQVKKPKPPAAVTPVESPLELTETIDITQPVFESPSQQAESLQRTPAIEPSDAIALSSVSGVDPMMLEILRSEVAGHLNTLSEYLQACADAGRPIPVSEDVLRAVHTMHGAIAMVEITELNPLLGPLEGYVKRLRGAAAAPSQTGLHAIVDAATAIDETILGSEGAGAARNAHGYQYLADRLLALRNELPEPESFAQVFNLRVHEDDHPVPAAAPKFDA
ncbi:MAG: Hpt domain-containing protein, partial [Lysobacterales bacterium]